MDNNTPTLQPGELLRKLLNFRGVDPDLAMKSLDVIFWLGGIVVLVVGAPMSLFRELNVVDNPQYLVPASLAIVGAAMINRKWIPQDLRPILLVTLALAGSVFMVSRNGTLTAGGFPLLIAISAVFFYSGFRATVILVFAYTLAAIALLYGKEGFDFYTSLLGYGINLSTMALLLGAVFVLHIRGEDLREANERTQQQLRRSREDDFREIALMTQELRSPATAIYTLSQYKKLTPNMKADVMLSVERLEKLTFEIVNEAHGDLPMVHRNQNLLNLLFDVSQQMHPLMTGRNIIFNLDHSASAEEDYGIESLRVRGILLNLCRAAMFLGDVRSIHGLVDVVAETSEQPILTMKLTVKTSSRVQEQLITSWNQEGAVSKQVDLTRRELRQCQRWAEHVGGRLQITEGNPATVKLLASVPVELPQAAYVAEDTGIIDTSAALVGKRVLVVDDDSLTRQATVALLTKKFGALVEQAQNVMSVQQLVDSAPAYDMIMTDFMMPGGTGLDLINQLPADKRPRWLVVVTASALDSDINKLLQRGADLVLPKPLTADSIAIAMMELISRGEEDE